MCNDSSWRPIRTALASVVGCVCAGVLTWGCNVAAAQSWLPTMHAPHRAIPHRTSGARAQLSPGLRTLADGVVASDPDAAIDAALELTSAHLHFGLTHRYSPRFDEADREAHCEEYVQLFVALLLRIAASNHLQVHAQIYRSRTAFAFLGRAYGVHDWVRVSWAATRRSSSGTRNVDPTFHDVWLGSEVAVEGLELRD